MGYAVGRNFLYVPETHSVRASRTILLHSMKKVNQMIERGTGCASSVMIIGTYKNTMKYYGDQRHGRRKHGVLRPSAMKAWPDMGVTAPRLLEAAEKSQNVSLTENVVVGCTNCSQLYQFLSVFSVVRYLDVYPHDEKNQTRSCAYTFSMRSTTLGWSAKLIGSRIPANFKSARLFTE